MNIKKHILFILSALCAVFLAMPTIAFAAGEAAAESGDGGPRIWLWVVVGLVGGSLLGRIQNNRRGR